jgi:hypothetical protein
LVRARYVPACTQRAPLGVRPYAPTGGRVVSPNALPDGVPKVPKASKTPFWHFWHCRLKGYYVSHRRTRQCTSEKRSSPQRHSEKQVREGAVSGRGNRAAPRRSTCCGGKHCSIRPAEYRGERNKRGSFHVRHVRGRRPQTHDPTRGRLPHGEADPSGALDDGTRVNGAEDTIKYLPDCLRRAASRRKWPRPPKGSRPSS